MKSYYADFSNMAAIPNNYQILIDGGNVGIGKKVIQTVVCPSCNKEVTKEELSITYDHAGPHCPHCGCTGMPMFAAWLSEIPKSHYVWFDLHKAGNEIADFTEINAYIAKLHTGWDPDKKESWRDRIASMWFWRHK